MAELETDAACCPPAAQGSCCKPSEKDACCTAGGDYGCAAGGGSDSVGSGAGDRLEIASEELAGRGQPGVIRRDAVREEHGHPAPRGGRRAHASQAVRERSDELTGAGPAQKERKTDGRG